jgi:hypothetical protein
MLTFIAVVLIQCPRLAPNRRVRAYESCWEGWTRHLPCQGHQVSSKIFIFGEQGFVSFMPHCVKERQELGEGNLEEGK